MTRTLVAAAAIAALVASAAFAGAWSTPVDITNWPDYECGPRLARDSANNVHLVWFGGANDSSGWKIYYQKYNGISWSAPIAVSGSAASTPDIAIDGADNIHVVWHAGGNPEEIYYRQCTGGSWGPIVNLSNSPGIRSLTPRIATDHSGADILVVWHESGQVGGNWDIFARRCSLGTWGAAENPSSDSTLSRTADVVRDSQGGYHVAWEDTDTKNAFYRKRAPNGTWGAKTAIDGTSGRSYGVALAIDRNDNVHCVWHDDNDDWDIHYRCLTGSTWGTIANISTNPGVIDCGAHLDVDASGNIYVSWHDYNSIYFAARKGGIWRAWYVISPGANQTGPCVLVAGGGRTHLVWQSRMPGSWDVMWCWRDPDTTPPDPPAQFTAAGSDRKVYLSWRNASNIDFGGTTVRCSTSGYPASPTSGTPVCDRRAGPGSSDSFVHTGLANGVTYYYSAFAYDVESNYSLAAHGIATTGGMTIGSVKMLPDEHPVDLYGKVITAVFPGDGCIYVQEEGGTSGIRVSTLQTGLAVGEWVNVSGKITTRKPDGTTPSERQISLATIIKTTPGAPVIPLAMNCRAVGGGPITPYVPGVRDGVGLNNIGLLVKVAGRVTLKIGTYVYVDDGSGIPDTSGRIGVMVKCPDTSVPVNSGDIVSITGVVVGSVPSGWSANRRLVQMRDYGDLRRVFGL